MLLLGRQTALMGYIFGPCDLGINPLVTPINVEKRSNNRLMPSPFFFRHAGDAGQGIIVRRQSADGPVVHYQEKITAVLGRR